MNSIVIRVRELECVCKSEGIIIIIKNNNDTEAEVSQNVYDLRFKYYKHLEIEISKQACIWLVLIPLEKSAWTEVGNRR